MSRFQLVTLLLALSMALNLGCASGIIAIYAGATLANAIPVGGSAVGGVMTLFLAGVGVYRAPRS